MGSTLLHPPVPERVASPGLAPAPARPRLDSVDRVRGLVMVLMALDHVRDFWGDLSFDATNLSDPRGSAPLFLTRWVTHFCAPTFIFLTGVSAYLAAGRGRTTAQLAAFLLSRGLWIVFLEIALIGPLWSGFDFTYSTPGAGVFWAIGWSMVVLSGLVFLPRAAVLGVGLALVFGHNLLDPIRPEQWGDAAWLWHVLHVQGRFPLKDDWFFGVGYPLVPWVGVMALGYALGPVLRFDAPRRRRWLVGVGLAATLGFVAVRAANVYGDTFRPWYYFADPVYLVLSFLNCHKYPPSLCYLLMTLGPAVLLLAAFEAPAGPAGRVLTVFGRVPMFYYLLHLPLIVGTLTLTVLAGHALGLLPDLATVRKADGLHVPLWGIYLLWLAALAILYLPCRWFAGVKQRNRAAWLSYL